MSQQASVTLNTIVYDPAGSDKGIVKWVNRAGGLLNSFSTLSQRFLTGVGGLKLNKLSFKVEVPIVATSDTTCSCSGSLLRMNQASIEFSISPSATLAERTDIYLRVVSLIQSDLVKLGVENLDPAYA